MKGNKNHNKGRIINIVIISMQIISPIFANVVNMLTISQIDSMFSMIKHYVAFGTMLQIDNLFVTMFPQQVIQSVKALNDAGILTI